ncbi:MAG TPA: permease [Actinomycetota bacterium]|nr:permease [Actinomycetota bacterium]
MLQDIGEGFAIGAGLFWRAAWALALGYAVSALIQVFVSRGEAAKHMGRAGVRPVGLAMALGFASSSCSFAALSATRSLYAKGADLIAALAFMFASTNLAIEVAALAVVFLGWPFAVALFLGAPILVAVMAILVRLTRPRRLAEEARERAGDTIGHEMQPGKDLPEGVADRVRAKQAWAQVGRSYIGEWRMVWKELLVGFTVAGLVTAMVPQAFFQALFPTGLATWLLVPLHALLAPVLAIFTVIGSMGNGPLAAVLWANGVAFGAIMAFLYSDFIVPPSLKINARYYGWRFAFYLGSIFAVSAVIAGIIVHGLFAVTGFIPDEARDVKQLSRFAVDYTFFLNVFALAVSIALIALARRSSSEHADSTEA